MTEPINIPINVTAGDIRAIDTLKARLRDLRASGQMDFTQTLNQMVQQWNAARTQLGAGAMTGSTAPEGLNLRDRMQAQAAAPQGDFPAPSHWRRVPPGGAIRPVAVSPLQGPNLPPPPSVTYRGRFTPWAPGMTPLRQAHAMQFGAPTPLQQAHAQLLASQSAAAQAGVPLAQATWIAAQMAGQQTPLQMAHAMQFGGTTTPLQQAHAQMQAQRASATQGGLQQAQLVSLLAQLGPQARTGGGGGAGGGFLGALLGGVLGGGGVGGTLGGAAGGAIGGPLGAIAGSQLGRWADKAFQTVPARGEREVGILRLGDTLQQQFGDLRGTMVAMRREYQVLGQEGVDAMMSLARATGLVERTSTMAAVGVGRFYGMTAAESLGTVEQFRMAGIVDPNLASVTAVGSAVAARHPGAISTARFLMREAPLIATAGGFAAEPMAQPLPERYGEYIAGFGPRYAAQPGAAYLERAQRLTQPTGTLGQVLQVQALDQLRRRQRYVKWGNTVLDLNDPEDFRVAQENIGQIPDVEEAIGQQAALHAGGNQTLQRFYYGRAAGATATEARAEVGGMRAYAQQYGGIAAGLARPVDVVTEQAAIEARKAAEQGQVGRNVLRARTTPEEISELAPMRAYLDGQLALTNAVGATAKAFNDGLPFLEGINTNLQELPSLMRTLLAVLGGLPGGGGGMFGVGAADPSSGGGALWGTPDTTQQQPRKPQ